jgi:hypothetical protein
MIVGFQITLTILLVLFALLILAVFVFIVAASIWWIKRIFNYEK